MSKLEVCSVCDKRRQSKNIKFFAEYNICLTCIRKNKTLKEYFNLINFEADHNYNHGEVHNIISSLIKKNQDDKEIKNNIKKHVKRLVKNNKEIVYNTKMEQNITKTLNSLSQESLETCNTSLNDVDTLKDLKDKTVIRKLYNEIDIPNPKEVFLKMKDYIMGQEQALRPMAMAIVDHYCRIRNPEIKKNNIFLLGPTGTGKTEMARTLAKIVDLPLAIVDATALTASGYKGESVSDIIAYSLFNQTNGAISLSENSIVFIDEIDKKAKSNSQNNGDIGTSSVQHELLKILEDGVLRTEMSFQGGIRKIEIKTKNILFICAGAFSGLDKIVGSNHSKKIGLANNQKELKNDFYLDGLKTDHLVEYGLIPEFIGRFSTITYTRPLTKDLLIQIMRAKKGSIESQYIDKFKQFKCNLQYSNEFIEEVAQEALDENVGARGVEKIFHQKMEKVFFNVYDYIGKNILISKEGKPIIIKERKAPK